MRTASPVRIAPAARLARAALARVAFVYWYAYGQSGDGA
jgi:hypothetical protein